MVLKLYLTISIALCSFFYVNTIQGKGDYQIGTFSLTWIITLKMRTSLAGPGTNKWKPKEDSGKAAAAGGGDSYRRAGAAAGNRNSRSWRGVSYRLSLFAGPQSSHAAYTATTDIGKQAPGKWIDY